MTAPADPGYTPDPAPHPLASTDLRAAHRWLALCGSCDAGLPQGCTCESGDPRNVIAQLVQEVEDWREMYGRGRLVPPDADTRPEYAVRWPGIDRDLTGLRPVPEGGARATVGGNPGTELYRRTVSTWNGWTLVGPWVPVPTTPETPK